MRRLGVAIVLALVAGGCSGGDSTDADRIAEIDREVATAMAEVEPIGPGLGEAGPPPALSGGWRTDFSRHTVPLSQFQSGGPGKDGIPAIDRPRFAPVAQTVYLKPQEPVIELAVGGGHAHVSAPDPDLARDRQRPHRRRPRRRHLADFLPCPTTSRTRIALRNRRLV